MGLGTPEFGPRLFEGKHNWFWAGVPRAHSSRTKHLASNPHYTILEFQTARILGLRGHLDISPKKARILEHWTTGGYEATIYMDSTFYKGRPRSLVAPPQGGAGGLFASVLFSFLFSHSILGLYYST